MTTVRDKKILYSVQLALLIAIEIVFAVTPLGYLRVGIVEITFMTLPVAIGAILLGPFAGWILGTVFGLSSFLQCFGVSAFGTAIFAVSGLRACLLCLIPRMLMGILAGCVPKLFKKEKSSSLLAVTLTSLSAPLFNTVFFVGFFYLLYHTTTLTLGETAIDFSGMNIIDTLIFLAGINGLIEAVVCTLLSVALGKALLHFKKES